MDEKTYSRQGRNFWINIVLLIGDRMNPEFKWWCWLQTGHINSMKYKFVAFMWEVELLFL